MDETGRRYLSGINCTPELAQKSFMATKNLYGKANGTFFYQYVQSFSPQEREYFMNPLTHVDFVVFNRITKKALLAIEVDGYAYHQAGSRQAERDVRRRGKRKCGPGMYAGAP